MHLPVRTTIAFLLALLSFGVLGTGSAVAADDDVAWSVRTASNHYGSDRQNYAYTLNPGGTIHDSLVVSNHGKQPIDLAVYAADGFTTDSGQLDLLLEDGDSIGVGAWTHAGKKTVTIAPDKSVTVPFTVTVPKNATPGDYLGGIITSLTQQGTGGGINVDRRLALKVRMRVGGALDPSLAVEGLHVDYSGTANPFGTGDATVEYTVHNTGNAILTAGQAVSVSGPFGQLGVDADGVADTPELLPGDRWEVSVPVHGVRPAVRLASTVTLTPLLADASGSTTPLDTVDATAHAWTFPWALLLFLVVLAAAAAVAVFLVRRRREQAKAREDARVQQAIDDALRERQHSTN
jgi:Bacterial protein of unknown function (DUF916)